MGLRFRTVRTDKTVPYTVGGITYDVTEPHESVQLVQPRDIDQIVSRLLWIITSLVVLASLIWSTTAVGHLLQQMAPVAVAYTVAVIFDLAWIACMAAEWLMRYDRNRARAPYWAGWAALAIAVGAIILDGYRTTGSAVIGTAGGMVSVIAKGLWMTIMSVSAQRLSDLDQQWYEKASSAATAELGQVRAQRKLLSVHALYAQEKAALEAIVGKPQAAALPFDHEPVPVPDDRHDPLVYMIRNGSRVKIGTTTNLSQRISKLSLRQTDLLLTLDGGRDKEKELHDRFQDHRIGTTEWFHFVSEIRDFVRDAYEGRTSLPDTSESVRRTDELGDKRNLTDLVRSLRADGLDEDMIKERVRELVPDHKPDSLRKAIARTA